MKKLTGIYLACLVLLFVNSLNAQNEKQQQQQHLPGTPCVGCYPSNEETQKGNPNQIQNGNGSLATTYTISACGLNFTTASRKLHQRAFTGMTPQIGVAQPATF